MLESASLPYVSAAEIERLLPYGDAVDELRRAFSATRGGTLERVRIDIPRGELLLMPAFGSEGVGVKLVTLHGHDPKPPHPRVQGVYVLFSADGLAPELIVDGAALTERRTAAVSALATQSRATSPTWPAATSPGRAPSRSRSSRASASPTRTSSSSG